MSDLEEQHREISQEITALRAEVAQPPPAPAIVPDTPLIEEVFDTDMGEEDNGDISSDGMDPTDLILAEDDGAGTGFTTVQNPRKKVKKGGLKQKETRASRSFSMSHLKGMGRVELLNLIKEARAEVSDRELEEGIPINKEVLPPPSPPHHHHHHCSRHLPGGRKAKWVTFRG